MEFSEKQLQVVRHREGSLLVAAAAGSGKTTTLIAHITEQLLQPESEKRGDLRRMIVVTFTNAAAAEMKNRLTAALSAAINERPEDAYLRLQAGLVPQSQICTIDSLCGYLVRNYFNKIDVAPDLRIADKSEIALLKEDVLDALFEEKHRTGEADFLELLRTYGTERSDGRVRKMIEKLHAASQNDPFPEDWLAAAFPPCPETADDLYAQPWTAFREKVLEEELRELQDQALIGLRRTQDCGVPRYPEQFRKDLRLFSSILAEKDFCARRTLLLRSKMDAKPKADKNADPELNSFMEKHRGAKGKGYPEIFKKLQRKYDREDTEECRLLQQTARFGKTLAGLTAEFSARLDEEKKARNIAEFADVEHLALRLLTEKGEGGGIRPTAFALELQKQYDEIIVDEYQDINSIQEHILRALSGEASGRPNMFMVGDVKQSIYRFRQANPAIFMQKYAEFGREASAPHRVIDLSENYRSRAAVLQGVNNIFFRIMTDAFGGIDYDEAASLHPAAAFPPGDTVPEVLLTEKAGSAEENAGAEARIIGGTIKTLLEEGTTVWSPGTKTKRPLRYGDIVILLRTRSHMRRYAETLSYLGIPVSAPEKHGFFDTQEIQTALAFLAVTDNPRQDIPLASVMTSAAYGFTEGELAAITAFARSQGIREGLYEAVNAAAAFPERFGHAAAFLKDLNRFRAEAELTDIAGLMRLFLTETGLDLYLRALPGGDVRLANLELLLDNAAQFEKTSYRGAASFLRYIERVREAGEDSGEASLDNSTDNAVRIVSIHAAKGLEFPVVFLAGTAAEFSSEDSSGELLLGGEAGAALISKDAQSREKSENLRTVYLKDRLAREAKAEELRVLYVALTRASERLYICGWKEDAENWKAAFPAAAEAGDAPLPPYLISRAASCLDWILSAAAAGTPNLRVRVIPPEEKLLGRLEDSFSLQQLRKKFEELKTAEEPVSEELSGKILYRNPHAGLRGMRGVWSVSALREAAETVKGAEEGPGGEPEEILTVENGNPMRAAGNRSGLRGADRGTVYHKVMERIPPARAEDPRFVKEFLAGLWKKGLLSDAEYRTVVPEDITAFFRSAMGHRVQQAAAAGSLQREQPFILGVPLSELKPETEEKETVLIQGIIDMFFEENGRLILVDYKTDRVRRPEELLQRYAPQLYWYGRALEQSLGKKTGECYIYSFSLRQWIPLAKQTAPVV